MDIIQGYYVRVDGLINDHTKSAHEVTGAAPLMEYYHDGNGLCEQYYEATFDCIKDAKKYLSHVDETRKLREAQHIALEEFIKNALTCSDGEIYSSVSEDDGLLSFAPIKHTQYVVDLVRGVTKMRYRLTPSAGRRLTVFLNSAMRTRLSTA